MRMLEVLASGLYILANFGSMLYYTTWSIANGDISIVEESLYRENIARRGTESTKATILAFHTKENGKQIKPEFFNDRTLIKQWAGNLLIWLTIEFVVFSLYLVTMFILIFKSRFVNVAPDCTR